MLYYTFCIQVFFLTKYENVILCKCLDILNLEYKVYYYTAQTVHSKRYITNQF